MTGDRGARWCETLRVVEDCPPIVLRRAEGPYGPSEIHEAGLGKKIAMGNFVPLGPLYGITMLLRQWIFSIATSLFLRIFSMTMPFAQLSYLLEVQLLRCLLVEKYHIDKYSCTIRGLQSKLIHMNKNIREGEWR